MLQYQGSYRSILQFQESYDSTKSKDWECKLASRKACVVIWTMCKSSGGLFGLVLRARLPRFVFVVCVIFVAGYMCFWPVVMGEACYCSL